MLTEDVKAWIRDLVSSDMGENEIDLGLEAFQYYLSLELSDLKYESVINNMFAANDVQKKEHIKNFADIEKFMKNLGDIIWDGELTRLMSEDVENGNTNTMLRGLYKQHFQVVPKGVSLNDANPDDYPENYVKDYLKVYQFRNSDVHNHLNDLKPKRILEICSSMLICVLHLCFQYYEKLKTTYQHTRMQNESNVLECCKNILDDYKKIAARDGFHYLDVRWYDPYSQNEKQVTIGDFVVNEEYLIIKFLGEAGTGKTTALKRIELILADRYLSGLSSILPIYIELKYLVDKDEIIHEAISRRLNTSVSSLASVCNFDNLCLLLDGYNEVLKKDVQEKICSEINTISRNYPACRIIVSDRGKARKNDNLLPDAKKLYLYPISINQKSTYFKENINATADNNMVQDRIKQFPLYFEQLTSPLHLKNFVDLVNENHKIPENLTESYFDLLFSREANKGDENADYLPYFLERIAFEYNNEPMTEKEILVAFSAVKNELGFEMPDSMNCLKLIKDLGILVEDEGRYTFTNKEYYDYFLSSIEIE